ncbi:riboflavin kinase [Lysinibacillus yapensis]|uniref:riboflavin kinase n=1 Tax=Ureibacillus yapensis TaxID=2304605 RepID=UPI00131458A4|nr:riboflavin kinase [Lysinibacillus yapensis]
MRSIRNSRYDLITGIVVQGKQLGRTIGFPTANIKPNRLFNLPKGVYGVFVNHRENRYTGVMNVGERPSFDDGNHLTYEVHVLDFNDNLYGEELTVEIAFFVRNEQKFSSLPNLIKQLNKDVLYTANRLNTTYIGGGQLHA